MKVADIYYVGRGRRHSRRGPTDKRYSWVKTTSEVDEIPVECTDVEDALYFDGVSVFRVEWTPLGQLVKHADGPISESVGILSDLGYRQKQEIAKALGVTATGKEEELEERLRPEIEELQHLMENQ